MKSSPRPSKEEVLEMLADGSLISQYERMVYYIAHNVLSAHPRENFDDLVSEGYLGIMLYVPNYDPEKADLSTWVYKSIWGRMKTYCTDPKSKRDIPTDFSDPIFEAEAEENWLLNFAQDLRDDARTLVQIVIDSPGELAEKIRPRAPGASAKALRYFASSVLGWTPGRINCAWKEIQDCL